MGHPSKKRTSTAASTGGVSRVGLLREPKVGSVDKDWILDRAASLGAETQADLARRLRAHCSMTTAQLSRLLNEELGRASSVNPRFIKAREIVAFARVLAVPPCEIMRRFGLDVPRCAELEVYDARATIVGRRRPSTPR